MDTKTNFDDKVDISRSGRVRKKSSKLIDFQSPDEVEKKLKRVPKTNERRTGATSNRIGRPSNRSRTVTESNLSITYNDDIDENDFLDDADEPEEEEDDEDYDDENNIADYDELDEMVADIVEGVEAESSFEQENNFNDSKVRSSLYMSEKSNKRKILKDGKIVTSKVERKDKGKSRYTAYSLWAREFRKTSKFSKNQDLDFSNASRRLSELWANVSNKEKSAWRRKAKIQATKAKSRERSSLSHNIDITSSPSSFVNRATTSRTRKLAIERQKTPPPLSPPSSSKRKRYSSQRSSTSANASTSMLAANDSFNRIANGIGTAFLNSSYLSSTNSSTLSLSHKEKQLPNIEPIDAAAHLKLLGESLSIIGERLKEHEGQIALSGSLSVLLDSILCSLGPLLCLTPYIPGLDKKPQLNANLASTLDNIAYVMPGL